MTCNRRLYNSYNNRASLAVMHDNHIVSCNLKDEAIFID